jgi:hypothetical protein
LKSSLCCGVKNSQFIFFSNFCHIALGFNTHAVAAALLNSDSLTTDDGSSVFIKVNIADISHTQLVSFKATCNCCIWFIADSNSLTIALLEKAESV